MSEGRKESNDLDMSVWPHRGSGLSMPSTRVRFGFRRMAAHSTFFSTACLLTGAMLKCSANSCPSREQPRQMPDQACASGALVRSSNPWRAHAGTLVPVRQTLGRGRASGVLYRIREGTWALLTVCQVAPSPKDAPSCGPMLEVDADRSRPHPAPTKTSRSRGAPTRPTRARDVPAIAPAHACDAWRPGRSHDGLREVLRLAQSLVHWLRAGPVDHDVRRLAPCAAARRAP